MSVFRNIRIYPHHGTRSAAVTWELAPNTTGGDVYVAFSDVGTDGSWRALNADAPVPSGAGLYQDDELMLNGGTADGFYRLLLTDDDGLDHFSEAIQILGDITPKEYGVIRAMIHQEYTQIRVTNGFPVWHCIPRSHGTPSNAVDPDTGKNEGEECGETDPDVASYGLPFQGGFHTPVLTWVRFMRHQEGLQDDPDKFSPSEIDSHAVRLMAFPRPARGHMLVNPATDERFIVGDEVKPYRLRGIVAVAYEATVTQLKQNDPRYKFPVPFIDTKAYRRIPYWSPTTLEE